MISLKQQIFYRPTKSKPCHVVKLIKTDIQLKVSSFFFSLCSLILFFFFANEAFCWRKYGRVRFTDKSKGMNYWLRNRKKIKSTACLEENDGQSGEW